MKDRIVIGAPVHIHIDEGEPITWRQLVKVTLPSGLEVTGPVSTIRDESKVNGVRITLEVQLQPNEIQDVADNLYLGWGAPTISSWDRTKAADIVIGIGQFGKTKQILEDEDGKEFVCLHYMRKGDLLTREQCIERLDFNGGCDSWLTSEDIFDPLDNRTHNVAAVPA